MGKTIVGAGDPKAIKKFSAFLALDMPKKSYFAKKFMGYGPESSTPIQQLDELEADSGDQISYDLLIQMKMEPVEGDDVLENQEEDMKFYTDSVYVDQMRGGVNGGGRMTRKRTIHDLRAKARVSITGWWARVFDELMFMYLSGARGINDDFIFGLDYTGRAGNAFEAPDSDHLMFGGDATTKAELVAADKMNLNLIERLASKAEVMGGGVQEVPELQPIMIDGEEHFVLLMHPWQAFDLRTAVGTGEWADIQKAAAGAEGNKNPIFKGGLGMINNIVLHKHKSVIRFSDYGAGSNVGAARALFLASQAAVCAYGIPGDSELRYDWNEETDDRGNQVVITSSTIAGMKKTRFNGKDFGLISADTAAVEPVGA